MRGTRRWAARSGASPVESSPWRGRRIRITDDRLVWPDAPVTDKVSRPHPKLPPTLDIEQVFDLDVGRQQNRRSVPMCPRDDDDRTPRKEGQNDGNDPSRAGRGPGADRTGSTVTHERSPGVRATARDPPHRRSARRRRLPGRHRAADAVRGRDTRRRGSPSPTAIGRGAGRSTASTRRVGRLTRTGAGDRLPLAIVGSRVMARR